MIKKSNIILVFILVLLLDGLVLPGLLGFREGVLTMTFLLAMLVNWGTAGPVLWLGSLASFFLEFFWRLQPGSLAILFLLAALIYFFASSLLRTKRYAWAVLLSFGLGLAFWHNVFVVTAVAFAGFILCFLLFDKVCSQEKNIKFL